MATVAEDLIAYLLADSNVSGVTTNIHYNNVPESKGKPYIWIQLIGREVTRCLDGGIGPETYFFLVECTSESMSTAKTLNGHCLTALDGFTGTMGARTAAFVHAEDLDDDYETRQAFGDTGNLHVSAIQLQIGIDSR